MLETELMNLLVNVQMDSMTTECQSVQNVKNNVLPVMNMLTTVPLVLKDIPIHQNVMNQSKVFLLLVLNMSLLVQLLHLIVISDVKPVNKLVLIVLLVMSVDLVHQSVIVLLVIGKINHKIVKNAHIIALLVYTLVIVKLVKIHLTELQIYVDVLMDSLMLVFQIVTHVLLNV